MVKTQTQTQKVSQNNLGEGKKDGGEVLVAESRMAERVKVAKEALKWLMRDMRTEWANSMQLMRRPPKLMRKDVLGTRSDNSPKKVPRKRDKNGYFIEEKKT